MSIGSPFSIIFVQFSMQIKRLVIQFLSGQTLSYGLLLCRLPAIELALCPHSRIFQSVVSGSVIRSATLFRVIGCHPSGLGDFPGFNFCIFLFTICGVILKESKYSPKNGSFGGNWNIV